MYWVQHRLLMRRIAEELFRGRHTKYCSGVCGSRAKSEDPELLIAPTAREMRDS